MYDKRIEVQMCQQHCHAKAWEHLNELIKIVKDESGFKDPDEALCQHLVDDSLVPRWTDHIEQDCEPIALLEILDLDGEYRPAATLVLRGDPLRSTPLHYRADYTLRIPKGKSIIDLIARRPGTRLPMGTPTGPRPQHRHGNDENRPSTNHSPRSRTRPVARPRKGQAMATRGPLSITEKRAPTTHRSLTNEAHTRSLSQQCKSTRNPSSR